MSTDVSMKHKGTLMHINPATGEFQVVEIDLPIETYADTVGWAQDFIQDMLSLPKPISRLIRLLMGRYAWRELIGLRDSLVKHNMVVYDFPYSLVGMSYHKDKVGNLWEEMK